MVNTKIIYKRLSSLKNIKKITKSMKMVSASRYTRAEQALNNIRPYGAAAQEFYEQAKIKPAENSPEKEKLFIAVTSDKGLCGGVHSAVVKQVKDCLHKYKDSKVVCIGDKSRRALTFKYSHNFILTASEIGKQPPTFLDCSMLANAILKSEFQPFNDGKIFFNRMRNILSYRTKSLPIIGMAIEKTTPKLAYYDELDQEVLKNYLEYALASLLFYAMKENIVAELSARMNAMEAASKNAGDMIDTLSVSYNRSRQAMITREISEIVSGVMFTGRE